MNVLPLLLIGLSSLLWSAVTGLDCYSCDSDRTDLDCSDIKTLPKVTCPAYSESTPVGMSCGFQLISVGTGDAATTERTFRGCMVAGECDLLARQAELTASYRMTTCVECSTDACNEMKTGSGVDGVRGTMALLTVLVTFVLLRNEWE